MPWYGRLNLGIHVSPALRSKPSTLLGQLTVGTVLISHGQVIHKNQGRVAMAQVDGIP